MRSLLLATLVIGSGWFVSEARAQGGLGYVGGPYIAGAGVPAFAMQGIYSGGYGYYPGGYGPASYFPGAAWQGYPAPMFPRGTVYTGYRGHIPTYGYRSLGRGRTFGSYQPRFYELYQPRAYGMFDR
ncbi:MAG TPA: hypothetical protein VMV10_16915 [Pirellulales bacterium]|nr:hypothetical protein [Pirellulales bacterium]